MPEHGGINRTLILPDLPQEAVDPFFLQKIVFEPEQRAERIQRALDNLYEYIKSEREALQIAYDDLAKRTNELPEMVWLAFGGVVAANVTNQALGNGISLNGYAAPGDGNVVAVSVKAQDARTAGTLTVEPTIEGTGTGFTITLDGTNTTSNSDKQEQRSDIFSAEDLIGCRYTTTSAWAPAGTEIDVCVGIVVAPTGR